MVPDTDDKDDDAVVLGAVDGVESVPNADYDALVLGTVAAEIDDKKYADHDTANDYMVNDEDDASDGWLACLIESSSTPLLRVATLNEGSDSFQIDGTLDG